MSAVYFAITTYNEEKNIEGCIHSIIDSGVQKERIFVIDSFSEDETVTLARAIGVSIYQNKFSSMANQRNYILARIDELSGGGQPVMILDADERLSRKFVESLQELINKQGDDSNWKIRICRKMIFQGKWMKQGANFPTFIDRCCSSRNQSWLDVGHGEFISSYTKTDDLQVPLVENDQKGIESFIVRHIKYAKDEATISYQKGKGSHIKEVILRWRGSYGFIFLYFLYLFIIKGIAVRSAEEKDYALLKLQYEVNVRMFRRYQ